MGQSRARSGPDRSNFNGLLWGRPGAAAQRPPPDAGRRPIPGAGGQAQASATWFAICRSHTSIRSRMMRTAPAGAPGLASIHSWPARTTSTPGA